MYEIPGYMQTNIHISYKYSHTQKNEQMYKYLNNNEIKT